MNSPTKPVWEPQEKRGAPGSRDTGSDEPSAFRPPSVGQPIAETKPCLHTTNRKDPATPARRPMPRRTSSPPFRPTKGGRPRPNPRTVRTTTGRANPPTLPVPGAANRSADASPLIAGDVEVGAQRPPDVARFDTVLDGLGGGASAKPVSTWSTSSDRAPHRAELALDEFVEFRQPHTPNLRRRRQRFMAHPYRIGDVRRWSRRLGGRPRRTAATTAPRVTAAANASAVSGRTNCALPCRTRRLAISHWSPPPGTTTIGTPASSVLDTMPCPPPQITRSACGRAVRPGGRGRPRPTAAPSPSGAAQPRHHDPRPLGQHLARDQRLQRQLGEPDGAGRRRRRRDHHDGSVPVGKLQHRRRRLEVQRPDDDGLGGPVRARHLQRGQRRDQSAQRTGIVGGQADLDAYRGALAQARAATTGRSARAAPRRAAGRGPRCPAPARCPAAAAPSTAGRADAVFSSIHGTPSRSAASPPQVVIDIRDHQVGRSARRSGRVEHRHAAGALVDLGAGVGVVVDRS